MVFSPSHSAFGKARSEFLFLPSSGKEAITCGHDAECFFPILDSRMSEG